MWNVLTVEEFDLWFLALTETEQIDVLSYIKLLEVHGPHLGRPYADSVEGTKKVKNLKELLSDNYLCRSYCIIRKTHYL